MMQLPSLDAAHAAVDPVDTVEALRGEQSQLEAWVRESTTALEALNDELTEWQRDLTRQQAALDQREAALQEAESQAAADGRTAASLEAELARAREETGRLEGENGEHLQALSDLERQLVASQNELRAARKHADQLIAGELREMRRLLHQQGSMLVSLGAEPSVGDEEDGPQEQAVDEADDPAANDSATRAAALRRRGAARRPPR